MQNSGDGMVRPPEGRVEKMDEEKIRPQWIFPSLSSLSFINSSNFVMSVSFQSRYILPLELRLATSYICLIPLSRQNVLKACEVEQLPRSLYIMNVFARHETIWQRVTRINNIQAKKQSREKSEAPAHRRTRSENKSVPGGAN